jgi:hypothetical protein
VRENLTGDDLAAEVILMRDSDLRAVIIVEGESDCAILDGHLDMNMATSVPGYGKNTVLRAIDVLRQARIKLVVGVLDADFGAVEGRDHEYEDLIFSELYDLDADVFAVPLVARRFAAAQFDRADLAASLPHVQPEALGVYFLRLAAPLGVLRYISCRDQLGLALRDFPIEAAFDISAIRLDLNRLVSMAAAKSAGVNIDQVDVARAVAELLQSAQSGLEKYASGHDACAIAAVLGRRRLGGSKLTQEAAERALRSSVGCAEFALLKVVRDLDAWARREGRSLWDHDATAEPQVA